MSRLFIVSHLSLSDPEQQDGNLFLEGSVIDTDFLHTVLIFLVGKTCIDFFSYLIAGSLHNAEAPGFKQLNINDLLQVLAAVQHHSLRTVDTLLHQS